MPEDIRTVRITASSAAKAALAIIAVWSLLHFLWLGRQIFFIAFFAVLVGVFLSFFASHLTRAGLPRALAALVVWIASLALVTAVGLLLWPTLKEQFSTIADRLPEAVMRVGRWIEAQFRGLGGEVGVSAPEVDEQLRMKMTQELTELLSGALPLLNTVLGAVVGLVIVLVAGLFFAVEPGVYRNGLIKLVGPEREPKVRATLGRLAHTLRWWMVGTLVSMSIIATLTTLGLWLMDMPAAIGLGVIAGLLQFVPMLGPTLAAVPAIGVALIVSPMKAVWVVVLYAGIQTVETYLITPMVMKEAVKLPPALTILVEVIMATVFGFLGLLLAVPLLAVTLVLVQDLWVEPREQRAGAASSAA